YLAFNSQPGYLTLTSITRRSISYTSCRCRKSRGRCARYEDPCCEPALQFFLASGESGLVVFGESDTPLALAPPALECCFSTGAATCTWKLNRYRIISVSIRLSIAWNR